MTGYDMEQKILYYFENQRLIHISCSSRFYNGKIIALDMDKGFLILIDKKLGEVPIMFEEIVNVEPYLEGEK